MSTEWEKLPKADVVWNQDDAALQSHAYVTCPCGNDLRVADEGRTQCEKCGRVYHVVLQRWVERLANFPRELPETRRKPTDMWPEPEPTEMPKVRYHF